MSTHFGDLAARIGADGAIDTCEIDALRKAGWADGAFSQSEAEAIFAINSAVTGDEKWCDFFVETIGEYVINGTEPRGYVSQAEANWLILQIKMDGRLCSMTELELLVRIYERAQNVPESLKAFVLAQIEQAVLTGTGPTRDSGELSDTHVSSAEAQILRRVIFGTASDRPAAVSRREAEVLFRLKDATLDAANAPEWKTLFVQGVGNYLMGFSADNAQISRARALELEAFVSDNRPNVGGFMGRIAKSAPNALGKLFARELPSSNRRDQVAAAQAVTGDERLWLDAQIAKNGQIDEYDQALLDFIAEEAGEG